MCLGCDVRCCKLNIVLTCYDIGRIILREDVKHDEFLWHVKAEENDPLGFKAGGVRYKFMLAKKTDGFCLFYNSNGKLYCGIEEDKPGVCLAYPMDIEDGKVIVRKDAVCPKKNLAKADFIKMSKKVLEDYDWEWYRYAEIVARWNAGTRVKESPEEFLKFAFKQMEIEAHPLKSIPRKITRIISKINFSQIFLSSH